MRNFFSLKRPRGTSRILWGMALLAAGCLMTVYGVSGVGNAAPLDSASSPAGQSYSAQVGSLSGEGTPGGVQTAADSGTFSCSNSGANFTAQHTSQGITFSANDTITCTGTADTLQEELYVVPPGQDPSNLNNHTNTAAQNCQSCMSLNTSGASFTCPTGASCSGIWNVGARWYATIPNNGTWKNAGPGCTISADGTLLICDTSVTLTVN